MRLDHLLSKEKVEKMCFTVELSRDHTEMSLRRRGSELLNSMTLSCPLIKFLGTKFVLNSHYAYGLCSLSTLLFWCRCGWGTHPFPSRTRRLRPNRPMVLHWRRCGRAGGRQIKKRRTGKPDEIDAGFTSDLREKAIFLSDG